MRANDPDKFAAVDVEKILKEQGILSRPIGRVHGIVAIDFDEAKPETLNLTFTLGEGVTRKGTIVGPDGRHGVPLASKEDVADAILDHIQAHRKRVAASK